ncbi:hypothetical protein [Streptomyces griseus]|uniref:hypothetical protein n=1 Tax=Streptomyces griseus TaxID=1911 RepID=UPI0008402A31|nr:hypothetical protein [Streptomyces griseus]
MTGGLLLYARARQAPAAFGGVLTSAVLLMLATAGGTTDPRWTALATVAAAAAAAPGLGGQDADLDRTAAIRWAPLRAVHVLLIASLATLPLLAAQAVGTGPTTAAFVVRNAAGLTGLAALGAVLFGAQHAWLPVVAWSAAALFIPSDPDGLAGWLLAPPGAVPAGWTAAVLMAVGITAYALAGPRR